jgi:hypothetical protein
LQGRDIRRRTEELWRNPQQELNLIRTPAGSSLFDSQPHGPHFFAGPHLRAQEVAMPEKSTMEAAKRDLREGKASSTAAGEFVHEEMDHIREGKHGARSTKQAIAIGLSKARRAGVPLGAPSAETTSAETRHKAAQDTRRGETHPVTGEEGQTKRGRAREKAMKREPRAAASHRALARQAAATRKREATRRSH